MSRPQTCRICEQEVRYGKRGDITGYLHREDVDHLPIFGGPLWTPELQAGFDESLAAMAARGNAKDKDVEEEPDEAAEEVPEPEIPCHPIEVTDLKPRSGILQICNLILGKNKDKVQGWELRRLTHARGPYVGARGQVLSISDSIVLGARGPEVDAGVKVGVASWRDGEFDFAYTGILKDGVVTTQPANSNALKAWIKDTP